MWPAWQDWKTPVHSKAQDNTLIRGVPRFQPPPGSICLLR